MYVIKDGEVFAVNMKNIQKKVLKRDTQNLQRKIIQCVLALCVVGGAEALALWGQYETEIENHFKQQDVQVELVEKNVNVKFSPSHIEYVGESGTKSYAYLPSEVRDNKNKKMNYPTDMEFKAAKKLSSKKIYKGNAKYVRIRISKEFLENEGLKKYYSVEPIKESDGYYLYTTYEACVGNMSYQNEELSQLIEKNTEENAIYKIEKRMYDQYRNIDKYRVQDIVLHRMKLMAIGDGILLIGAVGMYVWCRKHKEED